MGLCLPFAIWLSLVFAGLGDSVWSLPLLSLGCFRSPGRPASLAVADLLWSLPIVGCRVGDGGTLQNTPETWEVRDSQNSKGGGTLEEVPYCVERELIETTSSR